jgi:hypothetical protein
VISSIPSSPIIPCFPDDKSQRAAGTPRQGLSTVTAE